MHAKVETLVDHVHAGLKLGEACKSAFGKYNNNIIVKIRDLYILRIFIMTSNMRLLVGHVTDRREKIRPEFW